MHCYRSIAVILLFVLSLNAKAAIFTVTSNADSGPGTLREALTLAAANGSTEKDFINFNLPDVSEAGRTIILLTGLPNLSSNLVIDGSTQPGDKFGFSNAKIIIKTFRSTVALTVFTGDNINEIAFYGLYMLDTTIPCYSDPDAGLKIGITITNSKNIVIGARNKGNVTNGYNGAAVSLNNDQNVYMADNVCGLNPLSLSLDPVCSGGISLENVLNVTIGDENAGNIFFSGIGIRNPTSTAPNVINVKYNNFGVGSDGVSTSHSASGTYFYIGVSTLSPSAPQPQNFTITVSDNLISHYGESFGGMVFSRFGGSLVIKHNWFGTDRSSTIPLNLRKAHPGDGNALYLEDMTADVIVGDDDPAQGNKFAYSDIGVLSNNSKNIKLIRNSFKCIGDREYVNSLTLPQITTTATTSEYLSGTSGAYAIVDVFSSDDCVNCSPETYVGSTSADAAGNWKYIFASPPIGSIIANAHIGKQSSNFTKPEINVSKIHVTGFDCGQGGKVIGVTVKNTDVFKWVDDKGNTVSTELELKNAQPGRYKLIIGKFCTVESDYITIEDLRPQIYDGFLAINHPSCEQANGSIKNLFAYTADNKPLTYSWYDKDLKQIGNTINIDNLPPGQYTFSAKTATGCETIYGPIILNAVGAPVIDRTNQAIIPSDCSGATGSITGITATGTNVKYSWKNDKGTEVATNSDLLYQPPGNYTLFITDDTNCGSVQTSYLEIPAVNDIIINEDGKIVNYAHCDDYDGSISGITVNKSGLTFSWMNQQTKQVWSTLDLYGAPAGIYVLTVSGGLCMPVSTQPITISSINGVSSDFSNQSGRSATCNESNGEITGLRAPGATSYVWRSKSGSAVLSDKLDLKGVPAGIYTLTISNATCSKDIDFEIPGFPPTVFTGITYTNTKTCQAFNTGSITVNTDNANEQPLKYRWVNTTGENVGFDKTVQFLPEGTYRLYLTDKNYCENPYPETYTIGALPEFKVVTFGTVTNTQCGVGAGAVTATTVTGGTGHYVYQWLDADNNTIGSQAAIANLAPGAYKLRITDGGCSLAEIPYNITDEAATPPAPFADNVRVYNPGKVTIKVNNPFPTAIYRLYESATSQQPLKDAIGGEFNIDITESRSYYVSLTYGYCESDRTEVQVFVSALKGDIANTFTPNGDGVNDYWVIKGLDTYLDATVEIFSRYGQSVFQSIGYAKPFDGNYKGKPLPAGVYYYIINLKRGNVFSGSLTILR